MGIILENISKNVAFMCMERAYDKAEKKWVEECAESLWTRVVAAGSIERIFSY